MVKQITLQTTIAGLPRIGDKLAKRFAKLGLHTVTDLLFYYPYRYDDFSTITNIADIKAGQQQTIRGRINLIANKRTHRRRMYITEALVSDDTGSMKVVWFNQAFITKLLHQGDETFFSGKAEQGPYGLQLISPSYEKIKKEQTHTARIVPVYSLTENLTEKQIRYLIKLVLPLHNKIPEWIPEIIREKYQLIPFDQAIREIHFPTNKKTLAQARTRIKFNELFLVQLRTQLIRQRIASQQAPRIPFQEQQTKDFVSQLPFTLTDQQRQTAWRIIQDMDSDSPMNRLLEGDVGSGKTIVAAMAMLNAAENSYQAVLMAPTEILARQHHDSLQKQFNASGHPVALLTRSVKMIDGQTTTQKNIVEQIAGGAVNIIVGTHALIQEKVSFHMLGLVVIDEQHRFGVDQRKTLKQKSATSTTPHLLSMTATPIPRSLALTLYGDLDLSVIKTLPRGRKKVITRIIPPEKRKKAYGFIHDEINKGRQAFVVCPLIEESDKLGVKAATAEYERLKKNVFPNLNIGLLHGKLKPEDKEQVMHNFADNKIKIVVSTSVVEVGIDVPNASVMMIEGAERFGLAQLHQFRGRVGRAEHQSYCLVFTDSDKEKTMERLEALVTSRDGFELAEKDLEFRGPGELYGLKQSGFPDLKMATLADVELIQKTKQASELIFDTSADLSAFPDLKKRLVRFAQNIHLE